MNLKSNKAITLIALIITIIILLILAGVSLSMVLGENGLINKAQASVNKYKESAKNEEKYLNDIEEYLYSKRPLNMVEVNEVYDQTGEIEGKLHVGDFVNYSAGTWDGDNGTEYKKIASSTGVTPNNSSNLPTGNYQFGGFTSIASRDENASKYNNWIGITDKKTGKSVTGWRIFDVTDKKITLISAGCPEDYFHVNANNYSGYISEYILTGSTKASSDIINSVGIGTTYKPRDWSMYLSDKYKLTGSATVLNVEKLEKWYQKYMGVTLKRYDKETFRNYLWHKI